MTVLTPPRSDVIEQALALATIWCNGHTIDGGPALTHACAVAVLLGEHLPDAPDELIAAALLHDSPEYAGEQLDETVTGALGVRVLELIRSIDGEHQAMAGYHRNPAAAVRQLEDLAVTQPMVFAASAADKVTSFRAIFRRAGEGADAAAYWKKRSAFLAHVPYFRAFADRAALTVPPDLAKLLEDLVVRAEWARSEALVDNE